jgi:hypothetical protein
MVLLAALENNMFLEVLTSLKEVRIQLQRQLAQRPEYRALLIVDRAAEQLADEFEAANTLDAAEFGGAEMEEASLETFAAEPENVVPNYAPIANVEPEEPVKIAASITQYSPESLELSDARIDEAPPHPNAPTENSAKNSSRAIDLFLSSTAQIAAPIAAPARSRSYLPFVAPARPVKSADVS